MLYALFHDLLASLPGANLLRYISFRAVAAAVTAFVMALIAGRVMIRWLARAGVREDTAKTASATLAAMHEDKRGTPTMGGLFLIAKSTFEIHNKLEGDEQASPYAPNTLFFQVTKLTLAGKDYDLSQMGAFGGRGMMGGAGGHMGGRGMMNGRGW